MPEPDAGLASAFEWASARYLKGTVSDLLQSPEPYRQCLGIDACAGHGVNPGHLDTLTSHLDAKVRCSAFRTVGQLGLRDLQTHCTSTVAVSEGECRFWAAWAAVLLGDRGRALEILTQHGFTDGAWRGRAFRLALQTMSPAAAHQALQRTGTDPGRIRWLISGSGIVGDSSYVPWLLRHMRNDALARLAGEAFTLITGADLDVLQLWRGRPESFESGPTDDPEDENVDLDPDEGLMWPDVEKVQRWWDANGHRFQPGTRYFMGQPVTREHCIHLLKEGYQRQRILAAHYLCLLNPGTPLFNTSAPAWRQQRLLATLA